MPCENGDIPTAESLLDAADRLTGFQRFPVPAGDSLLDGGDAALDPEIKAILFNQEIKPRLRLFYQAHEYAHFWLHQDHVNQPDSGFDPEAFEEPLPVGVNRVQGYGPEELREREANVFAREFLLPTDVLREWYENERVGASDIADRLGLPKGMVLHQMARAFAYTGFSSNTRAI